MKGKSYCLHKLASNKANSEHDTKSNIDEIERIRMVFAKTRIHIVLDLYLYFLPTITVSWDNKNKMNHIFTGTRKTEPRKITFKEFWS